VELVTVSRVSRGVSYNQTSHVDLVTYMFSHPFRKRVDYISQMLVQVTMNMPIYTNLGTQLAFTDIHALFNIHKGVLWYRCRDDFIVCLYWKTVPSVLITRYTLKVLTVRN